MDAFASRLQDFSGTLGATVYWNSTSKLATATASGNTEIGNAVAAAVAGSATLRVRLKAF